MISDPEIVACVDYNTGFSLSKDKDGITSLIATKCDTGMKPFHSRNGVRFNIPSGLKGYSGEVVNAYIERVRPLPGEVFRITPLSFSFARSRKKVKEEPYTTKGSIVLPRMYLSKYIKRNFDNDLSVVFIDTTLDTLSDGYLVCRVVDGKRGRVSVDQCSLKECSTGLKAGHLKGILDFLDRNGKSFDNYQYETTIEHQGTLGGLICFSEKDK